MGIVTWIFLGLIAGALGKLLMPGDDPGGLVATMGIGIAGAFVGGFLGSVVGVGSITGFNVGSILTAAAGSMVLLFVYRKIKS